jgi:hypothetical protein
MLDFAFTYVDSVTFNKEDFERKLHSSVVQATTKFTASAVSAVFSYDGRINSFTSEVFS